MYLLLFKWVYIFVSHEHFIQELLFIIFSEKIAKDPTRYWVLAIRRKGEGFCLILELFLALFHLQWFACLGRLSWEAVSASFHPGFRLF